MAPQHELLLDAVRLSHHSGPDLKEDWKNLLTTIRDDFDIEHTAIWYNKNIISENVNGIN